MIGVAVVAVSQNQQLKDKLSSGLRMQPKQAKIKKDDKI